jgi:hypothetical protein
VWTDLIVLAHHQGTDILRGWSFHVAPASFVENHTSVRIIPTTSGLPLGVTAADLSAARCGSQPIAERGLSDPPAALMRERDDADVPPTA